MGGILAKGQRWLAGASPLLDRGTQRVDEGAQILCVKPRAGGARHHAAAVAACGFSALVGGELFSPGQRRIGFGPLRSSRLALPAPPLLPDATEPLVLRPDAAEIRRGDNARRPAGTPNHRTGAAGNERLVADRSRAPDKDTTIRTGVSQTAVLPASQCPGPTVAHENTEGPTGIRRH